MDEERFAALAELKVTLEAEFEERLASELGALRAALEAAAYKDKIDALGAQKTKLEAEAEAAREALAARLAAEKAEALRELEARITGEWSAKLSALKADYEGQIDALRAKIAQLEARTQICRGEQDLGSAPRPINRCHTCGFPPCPTASGVTAGRGV